MRQTPRAQSARGSLLLLAATLLLSGLAYHLFTAALPIYLETLGFDPALVGLVLSGGALAQVGAAILVGPAIDRFGPRALLAAGTACYVVAAVGLSVVSAPLAVAGLRMVQGLGFSAVMPAAYSVVPHLAPAPRLTLAFSMVGLAGNLAMAIGPPLGLTLHASLGPHALFATSALLALACLAATRVLVSPRAGRRTLRLTFRRAWLAPLVVAVLTATQFGVLIAFVPLQANAVGANPSLLFTADATALLLLRVPAGWLAGRLGSVAVTVAGILCMVVSVVLLLLPIDDPVLLASGAFNGIGAALVIPPLMADLSGRSDDTSRGTALSYWTMAFALGIMLGSGLGGLLYAPLGFSGLLVVGAIICAAALPIAVVDLRYASPVRSSRSQ